MKPHQCGNSADPETLHPGDKAALTDFKRYLELGYAEDQGTASAEDTAWMREYEKGKDYRA